ncbi:MAG TPA: IPT/TIG domain-containing protein [Terriglobia bacterium]|nr:IPT/TIG domain-containing protein [Terriglobia bacterium]
MKSSVPERNFAACVIALLAAVVPLFFTGCRSDVIAPLDANTSQQASAPTIKSIVPDTAPPAGGAAVTINGSNFSSRANTTPPSVSFGGVAAKHVRVVSSSQLVATVPPHRSGKVNVQVTTADGMSSSVPGVFTYTASSPEVSSVTPNSGGTAGGTVVTITGSNFASGATVSFGGSAASGISFVSANQLRATTPPHASGSVSVAVTNPDSTSAALPGGFTFGTTSSSLTVSSVSPASGPAAGGTKVTISGANFQAGVSVTFGGLPAASVTLSNSSAIVAVAPQHSSGPATLTITNTSGQSASWAKNYTFHSIDLLWNAPSTSPITIAGYNVYRGNSSAGPFGKLNGSTPLSDTSYIDPTVEGSTTYYYEVKSVDSNGTESPPAGPVPATTSP